MYTPETIKRVHISQTQESFRNQLEIEAPISNAIAQMHILSHPVSTIDLIIYRLQGDNSAALWRGVVTGCTFDSNNATAKMACNSQANSLASKAGLRRRYQAKCTHNLYDSGCTADRNNFSAQGTISAIDGFRLSSDAFSSQDDGYFSNGGKLVFANGRQYLVLTHTGANVDLLGPPVGLKVGDSFTAYAGCDHSTSDCNNKFNNILNFGGQPGRGGNPFTGDSIA